MDLDNLAAVKAYGYTPAEERMIWEETEKRYPLLWRRCYPRIYNDYKPGDYYTPKSVARTIFGIAMKLEMGAVGESEKIECMWASFMARRKNPTYWVTRDMIEAVMKTTPPLQVDWYNMPMPHSAMAFMLPKGALGHAIDGDFEFVSFMRARREDWVDSVADSGPKKLASENGSFVLFVKNRRYLIHFNMPHQQFPVVDLRQIEEALTRYEHHRHSTGWWLSTAEMNKDDTAAGIKAAHLVFGLLLLMTRKPELVSGGELTRSIPGKKGALPREFWNPSVIGRDYRIKRMPVELGGTHASPRYHWVKGYWRGQAYGPKNASVREIWVEPYERGMED